MAMLCPCGQHNDTTAADPYTIIQYDKQGSIVYAVCIHGVVVVDKRGKARPQEDNVLGQIGFVKSAEINEEGRVIAQMVITDSDVADEIGALVSVDLGMSLSAHLILSPEAKKQLVLEIPRVPVVDKRR